MIDDPKGKPFVNRIKQLDRSSSDVADVIGNFLVEAFHRVALFVIGAINAFAAGLTAWHLIADDAPITLDHLLLLFIYLEIGAMVGIYFKTRHMPVRYLIYVAMTALTRLLISDAGMHHRSSMDLILISGSILVLSAAVFALRYGSYKYPSDSKVREE